MKSIFNENNQNREIVYSSDGSNFSVHIENKKRNDN